MSIFYDKGKYRCEITDQALGKAATGTPQFVLRFRVLAKVSADYLEEVEQQYERSAYFYITEKTAQRTSEDLKQLGFTGTGFSQLHLDHPQAFDFRGKEVDMYCGEDTNQQGEPKERWSVAFGPKALEVAPLDKKGMRQLDDLFGKFLTDKPVARIKPAAAAPPATSTTAAAVSDDDVPF